MRALKFLLGLAVAFFVHIVAAHLLPPFPRVVDLFLVLIVLNALDGRTLAAVLGGAVAGLVEDGVTGAFYGLHGFAGTIVAYVMARATQQLEARQLAMLMLLFSLAASLQQALIYGLLLFLTGEAPAPELPWLALKVAVCGVLGALLVAGRAAFSDRIVSRRRRRVSRVRI